MIAAGAPARPSRLLRIDARTTSDVEVLDASALASLLRPGDLLVINDAATLPASLRGTHVPSGQPVELRLAARRSLDPRDAASWDAVLFGEGDHRTSTELRAPPPSVLPGDVLALGPLTARIDAVLGHPRMIRMTFDGTPQAIWEGIARHGRPIQYAHVAEPLALWDVWTKVAGPPVAVEPPSAGFVLDWALLSELQRRGIEVAALTHAAGLSSTGDAALDARLPLPEPYAISGATAVAIARARLRGARIVALGTTVARALESAADRSGRVRAGRGVATLRLGPARRPQIVDVLISGVHERGTSHYELMRAFVPDALLARATDVMEQAGFRHHEFGDAVWVARAEAATTFATHPSIARPGK